MKYNLQLSKLHLKSFRGFEQAIELSFDPYLTVLIGDNASGKTTILDAIAIGLMYLRHEIAGGKVYDFPVPLDPIKKKNYDVNNHSKELENRLEIRINARFKTTDDSIAYQEDQISEAGFVMRATIDTSTNVEKFYQSPTDEEDEEYTIPNFTRYLYNSYLKRQLKNLPILVYYGCNSVNTDTEKTTIDGMARVTDLDIIDAYKKALEAREFGFEQVLLLLDRRQKSMFQDRRPNDRFIDALQTAIAALLDDNDVQGNNNTTYNNLRINYGTLFDEVMIDKTHNGITTALYLNQLSSGEKYLIGMVADLVRRLFLANTEGDLLRGKGIVLIDEIDLHLHPKWQRKVLTKLREIFPNVQFVVTTHSPEVLKGINRNRLRIIKNNKIALNLPYIEGRDTNSILEDAFGSYKRFKEDEEKLSNLYTLINTDKEAASKLLAELKEKWGEADSEIIRAESYMEIF